MQYKGNTEPVPFAKELRKNMTKEERHLWYDYLRTHPARKSWDTILRTFTAHRQSWSLNLTVLSIMRVWRWPMMRSRLLFWRDTG